MGATSRTGWTQSPFGFDSTAAEVVAGIELTGKRTIVTGASSGIGVATARVLASAALAVRDTDAGDRTAADTRARTHAPVQPAAELA